MPITLGLTYDTAPEKVQLAIAILKEIVGDHTETENDFTVWFQLLWRIQFKHYLSLLYQPYWALGYDARGDQPQYTSEI